MTIKKADVSIFLETRTPKKDGTFPVKIRVTYNRKRRYYGFKNKSMTLVEFNNIYSPNPKAKEKKLRADFDESISKAEQVIDELPVFTFDLFERKFLSTPEKEDKSDVFYAYDQYIKKLKENNQVGTAITYNLSKKSIQDFSKRKKLLFVEITPEFLNKYENWHLEKENSANTISMYVRCLRTLFNAAIADNVVNQSFYPFGVNKYIIPASQNVKRALSMPDLKKIMTYKAPEKSTEEFARDIWFFSYLANGMNMADLCNLKYKNIQGDNILFVRQKTIRTRKHSSRPISAIITQEIKDIIKKWGNKSEGPETYIFPILEPGLSAEKAKAKVQQLTKTVNKYIKRIATSVGINENITTYWARHSHAMALGYHGASDEYIGDNIGHGDLRSTKNYLNSFVDDVKKKFAAKLTDFNDTNQI